MRRHPFAANAAVHLHAADVARTSAVRHRLSVWALTLFAALCTFLGSIPSAHAIPAFARKYKTACTTCHSVFPYLNPFGEAFRRNGFRFPSKNGSLDSDAEKAEAVPLGQDEYKQMFPDAVWPDHISEGIPLAVIVNAGTAVNMPHTSAHDAAGNTFGWNDFIGEVAVFAAGAFNDNLTYFTALSMSGGGVEIERAYLTWSDIVGRPHLLNLAVGRIMPTLTSWGMHSTYLADLMLPATSFGTLYNGSDGGDGIGSAFGHPDGVELNGIALHRLDYSLGWVASGFTDGLKTPNSQDVYAHVGYKWGGVTLDGEGLHSVDIMNAARPWEETALTLDVFGYHGLTRIDNGTGIPDATGAPTAVPQDDSYNALGGTLRGQVGSLTLTTGALLERHSHPYAGTAATPGVPPAPAVAGVADTSSATGLIHFDELTYVVYPWLVPGVRAEFTRLPLDATNGGGSANLLRVVPGVAMLVRPNLKVVLSGEIERAVGAPPTQDWSGAGGVMAPQPAGASKLEFETVNASLSWGI